MPSPPSTTAHGTHALGISVFKVVYFTVPGPKAGIVYLLRKGRDQFGEMNIPLNSIRGVYIILLCGAANFKLDFWKVTTEAKFPVWSQQPEFREDNSKALDIRWYPSLQGG